MEVCGSMITTTCEISYDFVILQVEEMKVLVKVLPIWATTVILNTVFLQILNFGAQQAMSMDRKLINFTVPAASVPVAAALIILIFLPFYDRAMVSFVRKLTGNPRGISFLQRIGVGLFFSILAAVAAALLEKKRRQVCPTHLIGRVLQQANGTSFQKLLKSLINSKILLLGHLIIFWLP